LTAMAPRKALKSSCRAWKKRMITESSPRRFNGKLNLERDMKKSPLSAKTSICGLRRMHFDTPYLDSVSNGFTHVIERFKGQEVFGTITLRMGERSEFSKLVAQLL